MNFLNSIRCFFLHIPYIFFSYKSFFLKRLNPHHYSNKEKWPGFTKWNSPFYKCTTLRNPVSDVLRIEQNYPTFKLYVTFVYIVSNICISYSYFIVYKTYNRNTQINQHNNIIYVADKNCILSKKIDWW